MRPPSWLIIDAGRWEDGEYIVDVRLSPHWWAHPGFWVALFRDWRASR